MAQLSIVARNAQPRREPHYAGNWFLYTQRGSAYKVAVNRVGEQSQIIVRQRLAHNDSVEGYDSMAR